MAPKVGAMAFETPRSARGLSVGFLIENYKIIYQGKALGPIINNIEATSEDIIVSNNVTCICQIVF